MKRIMVFAFIVFAFLFPKQISAEDSLVLDSTDHYLGACQFTDESNWELESDTKVSVFRMWYKWDTAETELPVTIYHDGNVFAEFTVTRSQCDPYQSQWCNGDYKIDKLFPSGAYSTKIPNARQCLKPGGTGTILLYTNGDVTPTESVQSPVSCPSNIKALGITGLIAFGAGSIISFFVFKKK